MPPFAVLHVCLGNICRSPMAERLLYQALRQRVGADVERLYLSHSAGTGPWHVGQPMNPPAARQLTSRGADAAGFRARRVSQAMIDTADLVLCATAAHHDTVLDLRRGAAVKTFVLGEFGRLLAGLDPGSLPPAAGDPDSAYRRGLALVLAADAARLVGGGGNRAPSDPQDDLDDPWGMADHEFARVADQIERTVTALAATLTG